MERCSRCSRTVASMWGRIDAGPPLWWHRENNWQPREARRPVHPVIKAQVAQVRRSFMYAGKLYTI